MSFAKSYLKQYNADSAWNSLGAVGDTSAWAASSLGSPLSQYGEIKGSVRNISSPRRSGGGKPYAPKGPARYGTFGSDALSAASRLANTTPETIQANLDAYRNNVLAGRYFDSLRISDLF